MVSTSKSEVQEVRRLGFYPTKNSGRGSFQKGDGILWYDKENIMTVDVKEYDKSFSLSEKVWTKLSSDALQNKSLPVLKVVLGEEEPRLRLVTIEENLFIDMLEVYMRHYYDY